MARGSKDRRRRRRGRRRGQSASAVFAWTLLFIVLLNIAALIVFEPVRDPLDIDNYLKGDSLTHFAAFFVAAAIGAPLLLRWFSLGISAVVLCSFGIAAEVVQAFTANRSADFVDFVADEAGILAGLIVVIILRRLHRWAFVRTDHHHEQQSGRG